jgi:6-pyruvoyltetrahydropterin/6-carboxytetrahydropterin synthase
MYALRVDRAFKAYHFLIGGDWGSENTHHSHEYRFEAIFEGPELNKHGYLLDIVDVEKAMDAQVERFKEGTLNEFDEFKDLNPSIEHFSRILWERMDAQIDKTGLSSMTVRIWEDGFAWARFTKAFQAGIN